MSAESFITGKDASLESSISTMQSKLLALGFNIDEQSWLNPVDSIWSVHIRDRDCSLMFTNGKGATKLAALASALGEYFERLSCNYFWSDFYLGREFAEGSGRSFVHYPQEKWFAIDADANADADDAPAPWPKGLLTPELQAFYNPNQSIPATTLVDFNSGNSERGICTIPYVRLRDDKTVYFPVNVIGNLYVSNGMSAGNTQQEARAQALSEIYERHIKFRIISEGICLPDVPESVINRYPGIAAGIAGLRAAGYGILVKDASLGGQYPVMNVTLLHPKDQGCFASFGAHPRFEVALERALTELLQGRALDSLEGFPPPGHDMEEIASAPNIEIHFVDSSGIISWRFLSNQPDYPFNDWNFGTTTTEDYEWLVNTMHQSGHDIYVSDFTHLGVYACRIVVPGLSEIYPIDELEWENNSHAVPFREAVLNLPDLDDEECADLLETLNESGIMDDRLVAVVIGLAPGNDPFWQDLRIGELKTLLGLAIGDDEAISQGCEWISYYPELATDRRLVYGAIAALHQLENPTAYESSLVSLYGEQSLQRARALLAREERFFDYQAPGLDLAGCDMHQRLLAGYAKLHPN
ncbi:MAG: 30S ribosomal protein S12 methylthiotransferase accessory factor YcaO [Burkholderiaceae bacterium]